MTKQKKKCANKVIDSKNVKSPNKHDNSTNEGTKYIDEVNKCHDEHRLKLYKCVKDKMKKMADESNAITGDVTCIMCHQNDPKKQARKSVFMREKDSGATSWVISNLVTHRGICQTLNDIVC